MLGAVTPALGHGHAGADLSGTDLPALGHSWTSRLWSFSNAACMMYASLVLLSEVNTLVVYFSIALIKLFYATLNFFAWPLLI